MTKKERNKANLDGKMNAILETTNFNKALHKKYSDIFKRLGNTFAPEDLLENPNLLPEFRSMIESGEMTLNDLMALNIMRIGLFNNNKSAIDAFTAVRDTIGEKPTVTLDITNKNPLADMSTEDIENAIKKLEELNDN